MKRNLYLWSAIFGMSAVLFSAAWAQASQENHVIEQYAQHKQTSKEDITRDKLGFSLPPPYPEHGILLARGSFFSNGSEWVVVDLDAQMISRIQTQTTRFPDNSYEGYITGKVSRPLNSTELTQLVTLANDVWDPPAGHVSSGDRATDVTCDLVLFDGPAVIRKMGTMCPEPALVQAIQALKTPGEVGSIMQGVSYQAGQK